MELMIYVLRGWLYYIATVAALFATPMILARAYDLAIQYKKQYIKGSLIVFYLGILGFTTATVVKALMSKSILDSGPLLISDPWGFATLVEAYLAFLTFYLWVFYKEKSIVARFVWFVLIMGFGNVSIAVYMLIQIYYWQEKDGIEKLIFRSEDGRAYKKNS